MTVCNVKEVTRSDQPTASYLPTLFPSAVVTFSSLVWFSSSKALMEPQYTTCSAADRHIELWLRG